ncbi:MAG: polymerase sigma-70 factor, subfamily [Chthoniobacter sp.]|jgi:RNA polymerase sigma-70 factor (ECF subfamily)|nr:polymerase sigma-70 factor, subfamily [Chthoniobacter sp.]
MPEPIDPQTALVQQLFVQHIVPLRGFLLGLTADFHRVDDLVQETFLTVLQKAADFQPGTNFRGWVFAIARFKLLASFRDAGREPLIFDPDLIETLSETAPDFSGNEQRFRYLPGCLEKLAPQARRAMTLAYQHGHPPREIAPHMGWTANAVKVALSRARNVIRACIEHRLAAEAAGS